MSLNPNFNNILIEAFSAQKQNRLLLKQKFNELVSALKRHRNGEQTRINRRPMAKVKYNQQNLICINQFLEIFRARKRLVFISNSLLNANTGTKVFVPFYQTQATKEITHTVRETEIANRHEMTFTASEQQRSRFELETVCFDMWLHE